jgi:2'-5' RNA ligase
MRLFIALPVPEPLRMHLVSRQESLRLAGVKGKFTSREQLHLTVLFLGEGTEAQAMALGESLVPIAAATPALALEFETVRAFRLPPARLFADFRDPDGRFPELHRACARAATAAGFSPDLGKEVVPHATLLRFRSPAESRILQSLVTIDHGRWEWKLPAFATRQPPARFDRLVLFASTIAPAGPIHQGMQSLALGGGN